ncbi:hypothetical protein K493DRAFT_344567 [Basidiobolus meristosporus CBS 931.73]|uniref:Uncharacterized protein n=1 Tax=Basidiobolus meristosporus CBS 931.73 TaxID=1314790 RepID=A0A1Y1Z7T7_9FUNG|nr:hypothetical protein K493DRAFT_344567 [Basidiobolus meristosporus CBS 931.73]|eukprot:ORY06313.1 hypothetical protein K493DRAFT_344567 [Basidiobolus meristosporus CBS 931.73]
MYLSIFVLVLLASCNQVHAKKNAEDDEIDQALEFVRMLQTNLQNSKQRVVEDPVEGEDLGEPTQGKTLQRYLSASFPSKAYVDPRGRLNLGDAKQLLDYDKDTYPYRESEPQSTTYYYDNGGDFAADQYNSYRPEKPIYRYVDPQPQEDIAQYIQDDGPHYDQMYPPYYRRRVGNYPDMNPYMRGSQYPRTARAKPRAPSEEEVSSSRLLQSITTLRQEVRKLRLNNRVTKQAVEDLQKATKDVEELKAIVKHITTDARPLDKPPAQTSKSLQVSGSKRAPQYTAFTNLASYIKNQAMGGINIYPAAWNTSRASIQPPKVNVTSLPANLRHLVNVANLKLTSDGYLVDNGFAYKDGYWYKNGNWYKDGYHWKNGVWYTGEGKVAPKNQCNATSPCLFEDPPRIPSLFE